MRLEDLNDIQKRAVKYTDGALLIIAGAGSGKTRVLTNRIAYLIEECGVDPYNIMAITFTNKAAREMKERVETTVAQGAGAVWVSTFHSTCVRILRRYIDRIGYDNNFTIYDTDDQKSVIKDICKKMNIDTKMLKERAIMSKISSAKDELKTPDEFELEAGNDYNLRRIAGVYREYQKTLKLNNALDFDDLIFKTVELFQSDAEVLEHYQDRFRYIMVDEYQDTNFAQHSIVLQLTQEHQRVCVVGDDAQSIYSFRGANIDNILKFTQLYKGAKLFKLEQNYRSTQTIVCAANSLIEKNSEQIRKEVFSEKAKGEPIGVFNAYSDVEEGEIVANQMVKLRSREHYSYNDFAILYRTNAQSRIFEEALRKRSLPYKIYGGLSFYQRKEIKDVISYFRLAVNPNDEEAFKRVLNYPARGIGDTTLNKVIDAAAQHHVSLWMVLEEPLAYGLNINKGMHTKLQGFRELVESFIVEVPKKNAYELGAMIVRQSGIMNEIYQSNDPENLSRQENIEELINGMHDFCATREEEGNENILLTDFLSEVSLLTDQDNEKEGDAEKITLMTIHSAKGLEFKNVFVVGMEENLFPSALSLNSYKELEEERRLFYVAITRAEEHCYLSFAKSRFKYGKMEFSSPSRFLKDIDVHFLKLPQEEQMARRIDERASRFCREQNERAARSLFDEPASQSSYGRSSSNISGGQKTFLVGERPKVEIIRPSIPRNLTKVGPETVSKPSAARNLSVNVQAGQVIEHERFGIGDVIKVEGIGENSKATVRFRNAGEKQLLLKFARFKVVE